MALECTLMVETELPISFTCADGTGIEKGTVLKLADPMTVSAAGASANAIVAGIAAEEKIANDGKTTIAVYRRGIFKGTAGGAITVGDPLETSSGAANELIKSTPAASSSQNIVGVAFETAADTNTFIFELNPIRVDDPA